MKNTLFVFTAILLTFLLGHYAHAQDISLESNHQIDAIENVALAQEAPGVRKSNILLEAAVLNSISLIYERHLATSNSGKNHIYGRLGLAQLTFNSGFIDSHTFEQTGAILGGTYLTGQRKGHFEANAGFFLGPVTKTRTSGCGLFSSSCRPTTTTTNTFGARPYLEVGYRYQQPEGGFIFRVKVGTLGLGIDLGTTP